MITTAYGLDFNVAYTDTSIEPASYGGWSERAVLW